MPLELPNLVPYVRLVMIFYFVWMSLLLIKVIRWHYKRYRTFNNRYILNNILMLVTLVISVALLGKFFDLSTQRYNEDFFAHVLWILFGGWPLIQLGTTLFTTVSHFILQNPKVKRTGKEIPLLKQEKKKSVKLHSIRKVFHIFFFFALVGLFFVLQKVYDSKPYFSPWELWGDYDASLILRNFRREKVFLVGQKFVIGAYYGATCVTLMIEAARLSDRLKYPLVLQIQRSLHEEEYYTYASHTHLAVGYLFASMVMPVNCFFAAISLFTFGDTMSATIGIKYGKHRFTYNGKSFEGVIAGVLSCFFVSFFFVGWVWALAVGLIFLLVDLLTPTILKMSDNLVFPILAVLVFFVLSSLGLRAEFPLASWLGFI